MDINQVIQGIAQQIKTDRDLILAQIPHSGEMGRQLEESLRSFLRKYLPKRYEIGTGHIIFPQEYKGGDKYHQRISRQMDIVVFDQINFAPVLSAPGYCIYPHKGVKVTIEVKATLDSTELRQSIDHIASVKKLYYPHGLEGDEVIIGGIFAYNTSYKGKTDELSVMHNIIWRIDKYLTEQNIRETDWPVDIVCVLDTGIAVRLKPKWHVYPIEEVEPLFGLWYWLHLLFRTGLDDYLRFELSDLWNPAEGQLYFKD